MQLVACVAICYLLCLDKGCWCCRGWYGWELLLSSDWCVGFSFWCLYWFCALLLCLGVGCAVVVG